MWANRGCSSCSGPGGSSKASALKHSSKKPARGQGRSSSRKGWCLCSSEKGVAPFQRMKAVASQSDRQSERAEAFVKEAGKRPGAVLLEKGVVLVFQRKGSRPLPADEGGSFEVRMRTLKQDGKLVRARPHERMTRS